LQALDQEGIVERVNTSAHLRTAFYRRVKLSTGAADAAP